jgi:multidrug efflux pump subunit AcrB
MFLTKFCLKNPAIIAVAVSIIFFVGLFSLTKLPLQLFPAIERPQVSIQTFWRAASPSEVESELLEPQEDVLEGIPGLVEMRAYAGQGSALVNLTFDLKTDMTVTLLDIISRLNRLPTLPADAEPPQLVLGEGGGANETLSFFFIQQLPGNTRELTDFNSWVRDFVIPKVESVPGVSRASLEASAGAAEEIQIEFDPFLAAQYGIELPAMARSVGQASDASGGYVDVGRRRYSLRFEGKRTLEEFSDQILEWRSGRPVRLGDIATISTTQGRREAFSYQNGNRAIGMRVYRESGANVLSTLDAVKEVLFELDRTAFKERGLTIAQSYDPSVFIRRAISLLSTNLAIGIVFAIGVLWLFLRQIRATLIIGLTIPICLLATLVILQLTGRTLNVISLAGLAFAVGMVLDAAIVVLENIVRMRENGLSGEDAASRGTAQVWGALLASTATTVAIFTPIIFLRDVEGQLFADLALTIAIGVSVSLIVAVTVLPTAAQIYLKDLPKLEKGDAFWTKMTNVLMRITSTNKRRMMWIFGLLIVPIVATYFMLPQLNYLPPVKRDAVDAFVNLPPGSTPELMEAEFAEVIIKRLAPYMNGEKEPALRNYYVSKWPNNNGFGVGVRAKDQGKVEELLAIVRDEVLIDFPDAFVYVQQGNLFGGFGSDGSINMHLQSKDGVALGDAAERGLELVRTALPGANVNANPNPNQAQPEIRIIPNDERIREAGWTRNEVASIVRTLGDGLYVGEYFNGDQRLNLILKATRSRSVEDLERVPLVTPTGAIIPLGQLATIERTVGPQGINRIDGRRTVSLQINPPEGMPLGEALKIIESEVEPAIASLLPADGSIQYGGSANGLKNAIKTMSENFIFAIGLLFLLMAALFKSVKDSLLVVITIPLATVGGVAALRLLNLVTFQPMDLLTMIGFIILLGLVVNNAILLVYRTRQAEAEGLTRQDAVEQALKLRLRPIFMSTLTSIFGMLPMVLIPGAGSAIYRGLAATIVGGMAVSTIFTLILLPCLLRLSQGSLPWAKQWTGKIQMVKQASPSLEKAA